MTTCRICTAPIRRGGVQRTGWGLLHKDCERLMSKGFFTFTRVQYTDSTGKPCNGCGAVIDSAHAHRNGRPYHRECLT